MKQNESNQSVLEHLSFQAGQTIQGLTMPSTPQRDGSQRTGPNHMQGILWKRRDVFRNRWRPRCFVLHSDQRLLTYYLLANQESERVVVSRSSTSTPNRTRSSAAFTTPSSSTMSIGSARSSSYRNNDSSENNRRRTLSESSGISAHTIDCDVVPRGTIYLFGSTVEANEALTIPEEDLYALTITNHENASHCHLAARTPESREEWIQCIRRVCENENGEQYPEQMARNSNGVPYSPQTPMPNRRGGTTTMAKISLAANKTRDKNYPSNLQQHNGQRNGTDSVEGKHRPVEKQSSREKEILVVFGPVILYKVLVVMSLHGIAALSFAVTSAMALRWIVIQQFLRVCRPLADADVNALNASTIGNGSVCCRLTEDLAGVCSAGNEASLSHILVRSIANAIRQQPCLASKKYSLLPHFYSNDIVFLDLDDETGDGPGGIWVSKADEKSLRDIADCFKQTKERQQSPVGLLQHSIGPACRIVMTSDAENDVAEGASRQVELELNLSDCPITVFVCCNTHGKMAGISINFQSTDVNACRKFAEDFQKSIRCAKI